MALVNLDLPSENTAQLILTKLNLTADKTTLDSIANLIQNTPSSSVNTIKSIQRVQLGLSYNVTSESVNINKVDKNKSILLLNGALTYSANTNIGVRCTLGDDGTTVSANRSTGDGYIEILGVVVEFY